MDRPAISAKLDTALAVFQLLSGASAPALPRHRHDLSRDDVRESQRARVLAAAIDLFGANGYATTTVLDIAKRAGVSRKTFYELYDTKEDVFLDAYQAVGVLVSRSGLAPRDNAATTATPDDLEPFARRLLTVLATTPEATRMFFLEALGAGPSVRRRRAEAVNEFVDSLGPILSALRGRADPASGELSRAHCHLVVAGGIELITEYLADHDPAELPDLTSVLAEVVRVVVLPNLEPVAPTPRRKKRASPDV